MNAPIFARSLSCAPRAKHLSVFLIAGEPSGDVLGAALMRALRGRAEQVRFAGVGGPAMEREGFATLLPLGDIAVMGVLPVLKRLPNLLAAICKVADAVVAANPDVLVIIDSPDLTHRVARRVRHARPDLPIVDYVSPSVWAWRPGRARRMRGYIDHVLALLPFEPGIYERLGGPACTYVGHPLIEQIKALRPNAEDMRQRERSRPILLVMPGSRESEIRRLMPVFGAAITTIDDPLEIILPTLPNLEPLVRLAAASWPRRPRIVVGRDETYAAMRVARAALVASGTATLELAVACVPMAVGYRVSFVEELVARLLLLTDNIALPNLILGRRAVPELLQPDCAARNLAAALRPLIAGGVERDAQLLALTEVAARMRTDAIAPSARAAEIIEKIARRQALCRGP
jgi:lipid-A-disaccharide synthase